MEQSQGELFGVPAGQESLPSQVQLCDRGPIETCRQSGFEVVSGHWDRNIQ